MDETSLAKVQELEQAVHTHSVQRQGYEAQLHEMGHARDELRNTDEAYRILGGIMVKTDAKRLLEQMEEKHASITSRVDRLKQQEKKLRGEMDALRKQLTGEKDE